MLVVTGESVNPSQGTTAWGVWQPAHPDLPKVSFRVHKHRKKHKHLGKIFANFTVGNNTGSSDLFSSQQINKAPPCSPES